MDAVYRSRCILGRASRAAMVTLLAITAPAVAEEAAADAKAKPPKGAVVLFDGTNFDGFTHVNGKPVQWTIADGVMTCKPGSGSIKSKYKHGSCKLHVEFATPLMPDATGQGRGNSGVYVQGRYEVQVLDSHMNETYPDGACGAIYKQYPPLVNACLPPKQWQTYDITFIAPKRDSAGRIIDSGRLTVVHNGKVIQDNVKLKGTTGGALDEKEGEAGPIMLQDHGNLVQFRNIWLMPLDKPE